MLGMAGKQLRLQSNLIEKRANTFRITYKQTNLKIIATKLFPLRQPHVVISDESHALGGSSVMATIEPPHARMLGRFCNSGRKSRNLCYKVWY